MIRAGLPTTTAPGATSTVTTAPAPTNAFVPIRTPGKIVVFAPILARFSIYTPNTHPPIPPWWLVSPGTSHSLRRHWDHASSRLPKLTIQGRKRLSEVGPGCPCARDVPRYYLNRCVAHI